MWPQELQQRHVAASICTQAPSWPAYQGLCPCHRDRGSQLLQPVIRQAQAGPPLTPAARGGQGPAEVPVGEGQVSGLQDQTCPRPPQFSPRQLLWPIELLGSCIRGLSAPGASRCAPSHSCFCPGAPGLYTLIQAA